MSAPFRWILENHEWRCFLDSHWDYLATLGVTDIAVDPVDTALFILQLAMESNIYLLNRHHEITDGGMTWNTTGFTCKLIKVYYEQNCCQPNNHNMILVGYYKE